MLVIPSIDLKEGCVVRFVKGRYLEKVYSRNPLAIAREWCEQGAELLHIVDLDGAFTGKLGHIGILKEILKNIPPKADSLSAKKIKVEFGGGIRDIDTISELIDLGVKRVVLSTRAIEDEDFLKEAIKRFGEQRIIISIDERKKKIAIKGWKRIKDVSPIELVKRLEKLGVKTLIYTDILRDGTLKGPNIEGIKRILENVNPAPSKRGGVNIQVFASGGIGSLDDIRSLKGLEAKGLKGVIVGKALYEKRFSLREAIRIAK